MKIPKEIIDEIKRRADIVDIIGEYITLRPSGRNWKGLCPFHSEKTPSFSVNRNEGFYYCFGCKETGNVFHFIQRHLNFTFYETIKFLGERYHVDISDNYAEQENTLEQIMYKLYDIAKEFYTEKLFSVGASAAEYFGERKISDEMIIKFGLGYAPSAFDSLLKHLHLTQYEQDTILQSGLIKEKDGKHYDFFRDRAMFPIRDYIGRTIAFGGRTLNSLNKQFKYINSADSLIYDKKHTLFGLHEAKNEIRKLNAAIVVEGYIDAISLYQAGIRNVVAPCGTALSKEQLLSLKKHTNPKKLYLMFDGDVAGQAANIRAIQPALEAGFDLNIIKLPQGKDPDSIINEEKGLELLEECTSSSTNFIEYMYRELQYQNKLQSPADKASAIRDFIRHILFIPDKIEHEFYIDIVRDIFDISISDLRAIYLQTVEATINTPATYSVMYNTEDTANISITEDYNEAEQPEELLPTERQVLHFALMQNANLDFLLKNNISENNFITSLAKDIFYFMEQHFDSENTFQNLLDATDISDNLKQIISGIKVGSGKEKSKLWKNFSDSEETTDIKAIIELPLYKLRIAQIELELAEINKKINTVEMGENLANRNDLLFVRQSELLQERVNLFEHVRK